MIWWYLLKLRSNNDQRRGRAVKKLGRSDDSRVLAALIAALRDNSYQVRKEAAKAPGIVGNAHSVKPLITLETNFLIYQKMLLGLRSRHQDISPGWSEGSLFSDKIKPAIAGDRNRRLFLSPAITGSEISLRNASGFRFAPPGATI